MLEEECSDGCLGVAAPAPFSVNTIVCYEASNLGSDPEEYDDEDSSEEAPDGPFNMITETYYEDEDYDLWTPVSSLSLVNFIKTF